jgi:hypothetical protein
MKFRIDVPAPAGKLPVLHGKRDFFDFDLAHEGDNRISLFVNVEHTADRIVVHSGR